MKITPRQPLPPFGKWSIEPSLADHLADLILQEKPKNILELGSGLSTVLMAYALEANGEGKVLALEDDNLYVDRTREWIEFHGLSKIAKVEHAPIRNITITYDHHIYPWYSVDGHLKGAEFDFVLVDGPASNLGTMARWPAYFVLRPHLAHNAIIVCDDMTRQHEDMMVRHWREQEEFEYTDLHTGRGACVLRRKSYVDSETRQ